MGMFKRTVAEAIAQAIAEKFYSPNLNSKAKSAKRLRKEQWHLNLQRAGNKMKAQNKRR